MFTDDIVRFVRRLASPTLRAGPTPDTAEIVVDSASGVLKYHSAGAHEVAALDLSQTFTGIQSGLRTGVVVTADATYAITAAESGTVFIATRTTLTQVFTLPAAATPGLRYTFVCGTGAVNGEIHVGVTAGDLITGKIHAAENGTALVTTATTGLLKNTAAGNVVGDWVTLVSDGITTWYMIAQGGAWSAT